MSSKELEKVIARVAVDEAFQTALAADPADALEEYDLSNDEVRTLVEGLSSQKFDALGADLGERTSRAGLPLGDIIDALGDLVDVDHDAVVPADSGGEIETLPTSPPAPEGADPGGEIEATPITLPRTADEVPDDDMSPIADQISSGDEVAATPITLPRTADEVPDSDTPPVADGSVGGGDEISATPITLPRTADEAPGDGTPPTTDNINPGDEISATPITLPRTADEVDGDALDAVPDVETGEPIEGEGIFPLPPSEPAAEAPSDLDDTAFKVETFPPDEAEPFEDKLDRPGVLMVDAVEAGEDEGLMPIPPPQPTDSVEEVGNIPLPPPQPAAEAPTELDDSGFKVETFPPEPTDSMEEIGVVPTPPPQPADSVEEVGNIPLPPPQPAAQDVSDDASIMADAAEIENDGPEIEVDADDLP